jgi:hypothetical protein
LITTGYQGHARQDESTRWVEAASGFGKYVGARVVAQEEGVPASAVELGLCVAVQTSRARTRIESGAAFVVALAIEDMAGEGEGAKGGQETDGAFAGVALIAAEHSVEGENGCATYGQVEGRCVAAAGACAEPVGLDVGLIVAA